MNKYNHCIKLFSYEVLILRLEIFGFPYSCSQLVWLRAGATIENMRVVPNPFHLHVQIMRPPVEIWILSSYWLSRCDRKQISLPNLTQPVVLSPNKILCGGSPISQYSIYIIS
jgi:hypothetical protein